MTSEIENNSKNTEEKNEAKIENLAPRMKNLCVLLKVVGKSEAREVTSRRTGELFHVADAIVGDETGTVTFPLWNDSIDRIEVGKTYRLENGYTGLFRGRLQLKMGRHSTIDEVESEITDINSDVDMSAKDHRGPRNRHYYQPRSSGGGYGGHRYSRNRRDDRYSRRDRFRKQRW
jgi:ssDNA-binding replication factor A large subunit